LEWSQIKTIIKGSHFLKKPFLLLLAVMAFCYAQNYNIYFGDIHNHTRISDGSGSPEDAFSQARDKGHADFLAVTDHSWFADEQWQQIADAAAKYTTPSFTALRGFELTESWGHMVILNTAWYISYASIKEIYDTLSNHKDVIAQWNHPDNYIRDGSPLSFYSPRYDSVINLLEIYNGKRAHLYEAEYRAALDKGWHVGPSANSDNHNATWITGYDYRTAIFASSIIKDSLFDAIRKHRTYATMDKNLRIFYSINGSVIGSSIKDSSELMLLVTITDPDTADKFDKIRSIELVSNNGQVVADTMVFAHKVVWKYDIGMFQQNKNTYYFIKVTNVDDNYAITAPIWINGDGDEPEKPKPLRPVRPIRNMLVDISGRLVAGRINNQVKFSRGLSPGLYFYVSTAGNRINLEKKYLHFYGNAPFK
jgi:predicted metal-dependent phosphoesterase TrpH